MKIILEGLKMRSEIIDCPDNIGMRYEIVHQAPLQVANLQNGVPPLPPILTKAVFQFSGKYDFNGINIINSNGDSIGIEYPRIYRLVDITKI